MIIVSVWLFVFTIQTTLLWAQRLPVYKIDTTQEEVVYRMLCKNKIMFRLGNAKTAFHMQVPAAKPKLVTISGNLLYDVNYRSLMDTPFAARNFVQHYLQTNLSVLLFEQYPIQVSLFTRQSNSLFFKDYVDVSFRLNQTAYSQAIKEKLQRSLERRWQEKTSLAGLAQTSWQSKERVLREWQTELKQPKTIQQYIQAKEYLARLKNHPIKDLPRMPDRLTTADLVGTVSRDSNSRVVAEELVKSFESKRRSIDSLQREADSLKTTYLRYKKQSQQKLDSLKALLRAANSLGGIRRLDPDLYDSLSGKEKFFLGLRTVSLGRSPVNYSDLSAKNISLTGINIEYSGRYYWAVAAGTVDYRFRDFVYRDSRLPSQYLGLVRFGRGDIEGDHLIFTSYKGRKNNFNFSSPTTIRQDVYGFTLQSRYQLSPAHALAIEAAKSSSLSRNAVNGVRKTGFQVKDPTTTAIAVKLNSVLRRTNTKISAVYRYLGANFQSFSLLANNANQHSYHLSVEQSLFKRMLNVKASLRKNDLENPYAANYKSSVVFKSVLATFRKRGLPSLSVGYLPSSQLTNIDGQVYENYFQMLTATVSHFYRIGSLSCHTLLSRSQYSNTPTDTLFLYAGAKNWTLSQVVAGKRLSAVTTISQNEAPGYHLFVLDQGLQYASGRGFSFGGGLKLNMLDQRQRRTGYYANCTLPLKGWGDISFSYESSFLPGIGKELVTSDLGRVTYYKRF